MEKKITVTLTADEYSTIMATLMTGFEVFDDAEILDKLTEAIAAMITTTAASK